MARLLDKLARLPLLAIAAAAATALSQGAERKELVLAMDSIEIDGATNLMHIKHPRITQDAMSIEADEALATGTNFDERSEWRFTGNVKITVENAVMEAGSAVFTFEEQQLSRGEIEGAPASFTHDDPARPKPMSGTAPKMSYDYVARTLRLTDDVWLRRGEVEMHGCDFIYNLATGGFASGDADCENPLRFRVLRNAEEQPPAAAPPQ